MLIVVHWDQKGHSISTPWQKTDKKAPFSKLGLHLVPATSDSVWRVQVKGHARKEKKFTRSNFHSFYFRIKDGAYEIYEN